MAAADKVVNTPGSASAKRARGRPSKASRAELAAGLGGMAASNAAAEQSVSRIQDEDSEDDRCLLFVLLGDLEQDTCVLLTGLVLPSMN
jgi:hypothetical protein